MQTHQELRALIAAAEPVLRGLSQERAKQRPGPGKWSPIELIGHLIDSASNNHQRFVRAQLVDHLEFPGYAQDAWVKNQNYQGGDWSDAIALWTSFNRHLANVIESTASEVALKERATHNLHEIAWKAVPQGEPATLSYFMADYVMHLKHHLRQLGVDA